MRTPYDHLISDWREQANKADDGTGVTGCALKARHLRDCADALEKLSALSAPSQTPLSRERLTTALLTAWEAQPQVAYFPKAKAVAVLVDAMLEELAVVVTPDPQTAQEDFDEEWRLVRVGEVGPKRGGHGSWVETDHPAVVACMGSDPACAAQGCQLHAAQTAMQEQVEKVIESLRWIETLCGECGCTYQRCRSCRRGTRNLGITSAPGCDCDHFVNEPCEGDCKVAVVLALCRERTDKGDRFEVKCPGCGVNVTVEGSNIKDWDCPKCGRNTPITPRVSEDE